MQNPTSTQLAHLQRGGLIGYNIAVTPVVGTGYNITSADIMAGTLLLDRANWSSGRAVEIGNADAAELSFDIDNIDGRWNDKRLEGATLVLSFDIDGEALAGGEFKVDTQVKHSSTITVSALDNMAKFNTLYDGALAFPATLLQIVQYACTRCGVTLHSTSFTNAAYVVTAAPTDINVTYHTLVAWVAQIAGSNAWMDEDGELRITWYGEANAVDGFTIDASMIFAEVTHGETELRLTGVQYQAEDVTTLVGTVDYVFRFADNPLLQTDVAGVLAIILAKISAVKFLPFESLPTVCLPNLWPGDIVLADAINLVPTGDGADIAAVASGSDIAAVTNDAGISGANMAARTYNKAAVLIGKHTIGGTSRMVGVGESAAILGYASGQTLSSAQMNAVKAVATTKVESLAIERTLTVGGATVVVRIDDVNGISITRDGVKVFGVDTSGRIYAESLSSPDNPRAYMRVADDPDMVFAEFFYGWYSATGAAPYVKRFKIGEMNGGAEIGAINDADADCPLLLNTYASWNGGTTGNPYIMIKGVSAENGYGGYIEMEAPDPQARTFKMINGHFIFNDLYNQTALEIYANNAAAVTGGLPIGALYRTGGNPDVVCIVH